jgi:DNA-binding NtrC family response regulator
MERRQRVLIVDDELGIRNLLTVAFTKAGYEARAAASALEATALWESEGFDALISDVRMPGMNGHELARWVVQRQPGACAILMSGFDDQECEGCGAGVERCKLLPKPFNPKIAVAMVEQALSNRARFPRVNLVDVPARGILQ